MAAKGDRDLTQQGNIKAEASMKQPLLAEDVEAATSKDISRPASTASLTTMASLSARDLRTTSSSSLDPEGKAQEQSLRKDCFHVLTEAALFVTWTMSGVDFVAPVLGADAPWDPQNVLLLLAAVLWFLGCACIAVGTLEVAMRTGLWTNLLWLLGGICYAATLPVPIPGLGLEASTAAWSALLSAAFWILAAAFSVAMEWQLWKVTRGREALLISLWLCTGVFLFVAACVDPGLDTATKQTSEGSAVWWCVGVGAWLMHFVRGGSLVEASRRA